MTKNPPWIMTAKEAFDMYYEGIPGLQPIHSMQRVVNAVLRSAGYPVDTPQLTGPLMPADLRIDTYRGEDAGAWSAKPNQCVRITHIPTGVTVTRCDDRSAHRNRATALDDLARLLGADREAQGSVTSPVASAECSASGRGHGYGNFGPDGALQCEYCGEAPVALVDERALSDIPSDSMELLERASRARLADAPTISATMPHAHPTGEQLYTMVTSRFVNGSIPWRACTATGKAAWETVAAEVFLSPDTILSKLNAAPTPPTSAADAADALRYRIWRDAAVSNDREYAKAFKAALPEEAREGKPRWPTADEWSVAIDKVIAANLKVSRDE